MVPDTRPAGSAYGLGTAPRATLARSVPLDPDGPSHGGHRADGYHVSDLTAANLSVVDPDVENPDRAAVARLRWLAVLLVAVAMVPFVQDLTAQPAIRYAQTAALYDHGSIELDRYRGVVGVDRVERDGHLYGDKAPLQPILALPAYAVGRAVGVEPATHLRIQGNLGLWWVTLWSTVVPLLAIVAIGVTVGSRLFGPRQAVAGTLAITMGTLLAAYGTQLYAHVLAALFGWCCWLVVARSSRSLWWSALAGVLGGAAVATEYPLAIVVLVCAGVLVQQRAWHRLAAFAAGGLPFVGLLLGYQWVAYGSPFTVSYSEKPVHEAEPLVVGLPTPLRLVEVLIGSRGMFLFTPIVVVALWGLWKLARGADGERRLHGIVGLAVFGGFLLMQAGWSNPWGGESPGPRYMIPALPFLIVGLSSIWDSAASWRFADLPLVKCLVGWSVFAMATTVVADHLVPGGGVAVLHHLRWLVDHGAVTTLWTMALGPVGWVLHAGSIVGVAVLLRRSWPERAATAG